MSSIGAGGNNTFPSDQLIRLFQSGSGATGKKKRFKFDFVVNYFDLGMTYCEVCTR